MAEGFFLSSRNIAMLQPSGLAAGAGNIGAVYLAGGVVYQSIACRARWARGCKILAAGGGAFIRNPQSRAIVPPDAAVTAAVAALPGEGVCQFMQEGAAHQFRPAGQVVCQKMAGKSDELLCRTAATQAAGGAICSEAPTLQSQGSKTPCRPLSRKIRTVRGRAGWKKVLIDHRRGNRPSVNRSFTCC